MFASSRAHHGGVARLIQTAADVTFDFVTLTMDVRRQ
jgi:hypothetical protein